MQYETKKITLNEFLTENQDIILKPQACYTIYGDLNINKKIALVFHGFSSNSELHTWWEKFNFSSFIKEYNIICINTLGSSHGTTGPESINPATGFPYHENFPSITIQDTVNFAITILKHLNISNLDLVFGCSLGGMQVLDMFLRYGQMSNKFISVAGVPVPYMTKLFNLAQIELIEQSISSNSRDELEKALGLSRFFFRLSCTTENALEILLEKRIKGKQVKSIDILSQYFIEDNLKFQKQFSPYSNCLLLKIISYFELKKSLDEKKTHNCDSKLVLASISNDFFTPEQFVSELFNQLTEQGFDVAHKRFNTHFGHEAWIVDGEKFYEFIEKDLYC